MNTILDLINAELTGKPAPSAETQTILLRIKKACELQNEINKRRAIETAAMFDDLAEDIERKYLS